MTRRGRLSREAVAALPTGSPAEILLGVQLEQAGIPFEREVQFAAHLGRKWRADFLVVPRIGMDSDAILVEIEGGSYTGGHKRGAAYESDCDKHNTAMDLGWRVYRFTPAHVEDGRALSRIEAALRRAA